MSAPPDVVDLLRAARDAAVDAVHVSLIGEVVSYSGGRATVRPLVRRRVRRVDGSDSWETVPDLPGVPVVFPGGGGTCAAWTPSAGDRVLVVLCDDDPSGTWQTSGVQPATGGARHALSYGFAVPLASLSDVVAAEAVALAAEVDRQLGEIRTLLKSTTDGGGALQGAALSLWNTPSPTTGGTLRAL